TEVCDPTQPGADANGCNHVNVPQKPTSGSACATTACDEASHSFPLVNAPATTPCNDGIACTSGDACDGQGACKGTPTGGCQGSLARAGTHGAMGDVDIPVGVVSGTVTLAGGAPPSTNFDSSGADIYLVAKDTGAAHYIGGYSYQYQSASLYT